MPRGEISDTNWQLLRSEDEAFARTLDAERVKSRAGLIVLVFMITIALSWYVSNYQHKVELLRRANELLPRT